MTRRKLLGLLALCAPALCAESKGAESDGATTIRGTLTLQEGKPPALAVNGKLIALDGDEATRGVLSDTRLAGADMEANGRFASPGQFIVNPIHTKALFVYHDDKRHTISYWCKVCSIRTYSPGPCMCCQEYTALDLQEVEKK